MKSQTVEKLKKADESLRELLGEVGFLKNLSPYGLYIAFGGLVLQLVIYVVDKIVFGLIFKSSFFTFYDVLSKVEGALSTVDYVSFLAMEVGMLLIFMCAAYKYLFFSGMAYMAFMLIERIGFDYGLRFSITFSGIVNFLWWGLIVYLAYVLMAHSQEKKVESTVNT